MAAGGSVSMHHFTVWGAQIQAKASGSKQMQIRWTGKSIKNKYEYVWLCRTYDRLLLCASDPQNHDEECCYWSFTLVHSAYSLKRQLMFSFIVVKLMNIWFICSQFSPKPIQISRFVRPCINIWEHTWETAISEFLAFLLHTINIVAN